jgi:hypothetical protein
MAANRTSFQPGNRASATHGLRSPRLRAEKRKALAQEIRDQVVARWPHLVGQEPLVSILIDSLCDVRQARDWLDAQGGPISAGGRPYKALDVVRARERDARDLADRLLVSPREIARLGDTAGLSVPAWRSAHDRLRANIAHDVLEEPA